MAWAALVSLMNTLNNIQSHPRVSTFFDHQQIQLLHQIINFLLDFVESSNSHRKEVLESRIASTAHAAEDVIESHVVMKLIPRKKIEPISNLIRRITGQLVSNCVRPTRSIVDLEKEIEAMNSVKETVMESRGTTGFKDEQYSYHSSSLSTKKMNFMVGFEEILIQIMDSLTGHQPDLQIIPIVGMGGIGKTTLAKIVYDDLLIVESFDIRAWVTISQEYSVKNVLSQLLSCIGAVDCETDLETEDHQLGLKLYQTLSGKRYLIVLDDIWSMGAWDEVKFFFPNNGQRSRIVITTRISSIATHLSSSPFKMNFLDEDQSWKLFCGIVFLEKGCPSELEEIGKKIVRECKGLPLSIVVIGGLLRNSRSTRIYWENFTRDLNSILISGNDDHCFKILSLSYNHLPAHLKPCFLYMGVYREDVKICVSQLVKIFVAKRFLKPKEGHTLEDVAEDYLNDLVDRNLILADSWKWNGRIKYCKIHDLARELCLKIGGKEMIFRRMNMLNIPAAAAACINRERCIVFDGKIINAFDAPQSASLARTFLCDAGGPLPFKFRLLRVLTRVEFESHEDVSQHVNMRYLNWTLLHGNLYSKLPSSVSLLWNLQTLIFNQSLKRASVPSEIWYIRQLRHLQFYEVLLPDPPPSKKVDDALLPNLQTLSTVANFSFTVEVCKRIPNIKKLGITYGAFFYGKCQRTCYYYLGHLHKLQTLNCSFEVVPSRGEFLQCLVLPSSLRKLSLSNCGLHWEDLNTIGLLVPHLQVLKLYSYAVVGPEWDCVEGAFPRLKVLHIQYGDLIKWTAGSCDFFPALEELHLQYLSTLENIPEIQTLGCLRVNRCSLSTAISSIEILEEQLSLGNDNLLVKLNLSRDHGKSLLEKVDLTSFTRQNLLIASPFFNK